MRKVEILPTRDREAGYGPAFQIYLPLSLINVDNKIIFGIMMITWHNNRLFILLSLRHPIGSAKLFSGTSGIMGIKFGCC